MVFDLISSEKKSLFVFLYEYRKIIWDESSIQSSKGALAQRRMRQMWY